MNEKDLNTLEQILDTYENTILIQQGKHNKHILYLIYNELQFPDLSQKTIVPLEKDLTKAFDKKQKFRILPINEIFLSSQKDIDSITKV